jgi:hemerythrin-like metal-binding protein
MPLIIWNNELETSIPIVDEQHQNLVMLINDLFDAMNNGKSKEVLGEILQELINYSVEHFTTEEDLMRKVNFSGFDTHFKEHLIFTQKVVEFNNQFIDGNVRITLQLMNFLKDWISNHIMVVDKLFVSAIVG